MRVAVYPSDKFGSGRYRMKLPCQYAKENGVDSYLAATGEEGDGIRIERVTDAFGKTWVRPYPIEADVIMLQRVANETTLSVMSSLQKAGHAVVVEIDDDLSCIHPQHPAHQALNPKNSPECNWEIMRQACRQADMVTVTTPALAQRYGAHGRVRVLPNCVPKYLLDLEPTSDGKTVGWPGFTPTHPGDLRATGGGVADALQRTGAHFLMVGPIIGVREQLGLPEEPEFTDGIPDIDEYYRAITRLDVGIVPLADNRFNAAKSWLKGIELAACGVPFVASPVAEYKRLADEGIGILAEWKGRKWRQQIVRLLEDESLREEMSAEATEIIEDHHTYETEGWRWVECWEWALANSKQRTRTHHEMISETITRGVTQPLMQAA